MATWEEHCRRRGIPYAGTARMEPLPERARDEDGQFKGDDPSTPDVNEAYEGGKAPAKKKKAPAKKKKAPAKKKASAKKK